MTPATKPASLADAVQSAHLKIGHAVTRSSLTDDRKQMVVDAMTILRAAFPRAQAADALAKAVAGLEAWYAHELRPERVTQMWGEVNAALRRYRESS